jgi:hypothetical protein
MSKLLDGERDGRRILAGALALAGLVVLAVLHASCGSPYLTAYRGIATARATAASTEQALADVCSLKRVSCLEAHGPATKAYDDCILGCRKALTAWTSITRPAINTALVAAVGAVSTAEAIKGKASLLDILRPVACALSRGMTEWLPMLPASARATVEAITRGVAGFVCPKEVP